MLFNSYEFIFVFLPLTVVGFYLIGRGGARRVAIAWLVAASLFFYGWWNPPYLVLLLTSVAFNFALGSFLARNHSASALIRKLVLIVGVGVNLASIGYYKYINFFLGNLNAVADTDFTLHRVILPLAISFFTFQQITFLVDSWKRLTDEHSFLNYCLFVTFFPQLIAGPIVHHSEMLPQFARAGIFRLKASNIAVGLTIFAIGLFKKAVLADGIAPYASSVFTLADGGSSVDFFTAWGGALAYTFQLYFDFSGYSDMALGGARLFGIRLPANFNSPYKARNIADFWRRWHMTLSRFLRDYVYIALGGNRKGTARRHTNLLLTMLIGGLWHGAGWTFVVWGGLHGIYLIVNHAWQHLRWQGASDGTSASTWLGQRCAQTLTLLAVVIGWVFFRATSFDGAVRMLEGMSAMNGISIPSAIGSRLGSAGDALLSLGVSFSPGGGQAFVSTWGWILVLGCICLLAPNSLDLTRRYRPALAFRGNSDEAALPILAPLARLRWRANAIWAMAVSVLLFFGVLAIPQVSEFLYYQF